jgi:DnaJ-class molecular chaperone
VSFLTGSNECAFCHGSGKCPACNGSGQNLNRNDPESQCQRCAGTGTCAQCLGSGAVPVSPRSEAALKKEEIEEVAL